MIALDMDVIVDSNDYTATWECGDQRSRRWECGDQTYPQWVPGFLEWIASTDEEVWVLTNWDPYLCDLILDEILYWIPRERRIYCRNLTALKWRARDFKHYVTRRNLNIPNMVKFRSW